MIIISLSFLFPDVLIVKNICPHLFGISQRHSLSAASSVDLWRGGPPEL